MILVVTSDSRDNAFLFPRKTDGIRGKFSLKRKKLMGEMILLRMRGSKKIAAAHFS